MQRGSLKPGRFDRSLRAKITLSVVVPLVLVIGGFTIIEYWRHKASVLNNLALLAAQTGQLIENSLQHAMLSSDWEELQLTLDSIGENEMLRVVYLLDRSGKVVFSPNDKDVNIVLENSQPDCQPCHKLNVEDRPSSVVVSLRDGQRVFRSMNPIENRAECQKCHAPEERLLGILLTDISMAPLEKPLEAHLRENLLWMVATILVTVLVADLAINRFVLRRLKGLASAITDLGHGQSPPELPENQQDEIGQLARKFNEMAHGLATRETENRELSENIQRQSTQRGELLKRLITAQEDERKRVARELHDELGQALAGLGFHSEAIEHMLKTDPERALNQLAQTRALIHETTGQMYDLIMALRPSALDDLGLVAALKAHADRMLPADTISLHINADGLGGRLPPAIETALYRIFQEALSNVVRHSRASQVSIVLSQNNGYFEGEVVDNGVGFVPQSMLLDENNPRGLGLLGMKERTEQCGGELDITSEPGKGTRIHIRIPQEALNYERKP
ncbi:MAG TPA: ATP-binding protein [Anaerolineales bacterium]|nr:ATP-binding protein [Anaerolineales bacterium]